MPTFERRLLVAASPEDVFEFISKATHVPLFAAGVEEANLLRGEDGLQGASLGLRTRSGRELRAQITHYAVNESWRVVDENDTVSQMQVEPAAEGTWLTATLSGQWRAPVAERIEAEWARKLEEVAQRLDFRAVRATAGAAGQPGAAAAASGARA